MENKMFDIIIVGAGPAGMTAAVYGARAGLKVLMLEKGAPGGQMVNTYEVENYTGFEKISGTDLSMKMFEHTQKLGVTYTYGIVTGIKDNGSTKIVETEEGNYTGKAVIIATGTVNRRLGAKGEEKLAGRGISWCAICDGAFFRNKDVVVVGGGNSAVEEALYLSGICRKVTIIHRRNEFRAEKLAQNRASNNDKIEFELESVVESFNEINGKLGSVTVKNVKSNDKKDITCDGAFIYVGQDPVTSMFRDIIKLNEKDYIITNDKMETNVQGIYAAGDVCDKELRQIITATNDGAIASQNALKYIETLH
ncbi:thioredoxin-disulfide reductase [Mycoplasmatota bacterium]|nr:thioredoxin-disulfide reductase [Mycoplasmatota bacterium]